METAELHWPDPDRTATTDRRWSECEQFLTKEQFATDLLGVDCKLCLMVIQARLTHS